MIVSKRDIRSPIDRPFGMRPLSPLKDYRHQRYVRLALLQAHQDYALPGCKLAHNKRRRPIVRCKLPRPLRSSRVPLR